MSFLDLNDILAKSKLDLDKYVAEHKNEIKRAMKGFPMERPVTTMEDRDKERTRLQSVLGPVPAQAAEAWIKLSNSEGMWLIFEVLNVIIKFWNSCLQCSYIRAPKKAQNWSYC